MVSLGPFSTSLVILLLPVAVAAAVAHVSSRRAAGADPDAPAVPVVSTLLDMLLAGVVAARLAFVLRWLPQYVAEPWSVLRIGDGGFSLWAGMLGGLGWGAWKAYRNPGLRRPLLRSATAGLLAWAVLGGALTWLQSSVIRLPDTGLATLDGQSARLSQLSGKPVVVNLWATWCPPCLREMPVLAEAQKARSDVSFAFVNQAEGEATIRAYLERAGIELDNVLLDPFSAVAQEVGSRGLPTTLFFHADGRLADTHVGELTPASLAHKLQRMGAADPEPSKELP